MGKQSGQAISESNSAQNDDGISLYNTFPDEVVALLYRLTLPQYYIDCLLTDAENIALEIAENRQGRTWCRICGRPYKTQSLPCHALSGPDSLRIDPGTNLKRP